MPNVQIIFHADVHDDLLLKMTFLDFTR